MQETRVLSLGWEDPLEEEMATHSSILAWRIPTDRGAFDKLQSIGSHRTGHNWMIEHKTIHRGSALNDLPEAPAPNTIVMGLDCQHMNSWEHKHSVKSKLYITESHIVPL